MLINRLRFDRAYGRLQDEEGLSLVELMVSLIIVGAVLSALASTIVASLRAITKNQREARAIALQTEMIERFKSIPWDEVGLHPLETDDGECDGEVVGEHPWDGNGNGLDDELGDDKSAPPAEWAPVVCVDADETERFLPEPVETRGEGDFEYRIENHVIFVSRDSEPASDIKDFETKRIVVFVSWENPDGTTRTIEAAAERSPPVKALGFVDPSQDRDLDNVPDGDDNCPDTPNQDQQDTYEYDEDDGDESLGQDDIGDACDLDRDGITNDNTGNGPDNCPNDSNHGQTDADEDGLGAACDDNDSVPAPDPDILEPVTIWKRQGNNWVSTNRLCVDQNDALSRDHRIRVAVRDLPPGSGTVEVVYHYWAGEEDVSTPPDQRSATASVVPGGDDSRTFYDLIIEQNTGKFRDEYSTRFQVTAMSTGGQRSDSYDTGSTVDIDRC